MFQKQPRGWCLTDVACDFGLMLHLSETRKFGARAPKATVFTDVGWRFCIHFQKKEKGRLASSKRNKYRTPVMLAPLERFFQGGGLRPGQHFGLH